jgi:hypothetical protein
MLSHARETRITPTSSLQKAGTLAKHEPRRRVPGNLPSCERKEDIQSAAFSAIQSRACERALSHRVSSGCLGPSEAA